MMRIPVLVTTVLLATVSTAPAARAQDIAIDCDPGPAPQQTVVRNESGSLTIDPTQAPSDADAFAGWVLDYVQCLEGGLVNGVVECVQNNVPNGPLVEVDPETLKVTIHYGELLPGGEEFCDG